MKTRPIVMFRRAEDYKGHEMFECFISQGKRKSAHYFITRSTFEELKRLQILAEASPRISEQPAAPISLRVAGNDQ